MNEINPNSKISARFLQGKVEKTFEKIMSKDNKSNLDVNAS